MELKNGYKVVYAIAEEGEMKFYASKAGFEAKEDLNVSYVMDDVKVIVAGDEEGKFVVTKKDDTTEVLDLSAVFVEAVAEEEVEETEDVEASE